MMIGANSPYYAVKQGFEQKQARGQADVLALFNARQAAESAGTQGMTAVKNTRLAPKEPAREIAMPEHSMGGAAKPAPSRSDVVAEFLEFASKTTAEKMRAQVLNALGLTEEDLENMTPEQRKAVEEKIAQMIKDKLEESIKEQQAGKVGEPQDSPLAWKDGEIPPLLAPNPQNIKHMAEEAERKLNALRAQYGIAEDAQFSIRFERESGMMEIHAQKEQRRALERLLAENPAIQREMQAAVAMTFVHAALQERLPFIEEYQAAGSPAQAQAVVEKYSHWFGSSTAPTQADIRLDYVQGSLSVLLNHQSLGG